VKKKDARFKAERSMLPGFKPEALLSKDQLARIRLALATECAMSGDNPNEGATPMHCEIAERWAAQIALDYACLLEVIASGRGIRVITPPGESNPRCMVRRQTAETVIRLASQSGVSILAQS
jgi:hypothetical protein